VLLRSACAALPNHGEAHYLLGAALHRSNQLPAALAAFDRALELEPGNLQAAHASLAVLGDLGRKEEAVARVERLLASYPDDPQLQYTAALVYESRGEFDRAVQHYDRALLFAPDHFEALLNRGVALTRLARLEEAVANNRHLAAAHPTRVESHFNLAEVLLAADRYQDAATHAEHALALDPQHAGAMLDHGLALAALGQLENAHTVLGKARKLGARIPRTTQAEPGAGHDAVDLHPGEIYLTRAYERLEACDWSDYDGLSTRFASLIGDTTFGPLGSPALGFRAMMLGIDLPHQLRLASEIARTWSETPGTSVTPRARDARIRVGYVSSDFRDHPMSHIIAPLLARHDRTRIEVYGYALCPDDGSEHRRNIARACDHFQDVTNDATADIAERIARDGVEILVNLNGYTSGHRTALFAMRPAPIQVSYLGFPATMGAPFIDYLIADRTVVPERDFEWYAESVAWLPHCYFSGNADEQVPPAPPRGAVGLPEQGVVYCDFNQHAKITPEMFATWMRILDRVPDSVLWLLAGRGDANLRDHAKAAGIDAGRLIFAPRLPRSQHLARVQIADLFLDTHPCNAHTTAADALRAGVPLVTCPGATFASRVAASLALAAGLDELVTRDLGDYTELAVALGRDRDRLDALKGHLRAGLGALPVFDAEGCAGALGSVYAEMLARHARGLPPAPVGVSADAGPAHEGIRKFRRATP
jgi:predicted O-linked N-acetylglucosamine transferase (SPINDLY family)